MRKRRLGPSRLTLVLALTLIVAANAAFASPGSEQYKFVRKWGALAPPGILDFPFGVAVDPGGNAFVADMYNSRIMKFDQTGKFLLQWGKLGNANGEFWLPQAVAVGQAGDVLVADTQNDRIQEFTNDGRFIRAWGSQGADNDQFEFPAGVAVDSNGNIFVADQYNDRIQKFTGAGAFIAAWGNYGAGNGQFDNPVGVAVDATGNVFVADCVWSTYGGNNRIQKFTNDGSFITTWGSTGSDNGQFIGAQGVAVDTNGNVFVADGGNDRVQKFTNDGAFLTTWGSYGPGDGQFGGNGPAGVAVAADGNVYAVNQAPTSSSLGAQAEKFTNNGAYIGTFGKPGAKRGELLFNVGLAVDGAGDVYVVEELGGRIDKYNSMGDLLTIWGSIGSGDGQFYVPTGVAVDANGNVFVADSFNSRVQKFTSRGAFTSAWGSYGTGDGQFGAPVGVAVDSHGHVFVTDIFNDNVQEFTNDGTFVMSWGSYGTGDGQFNTPWGVAVDADGNVFVVDSGNDRIQKFTSSGAFVTAWGTLGSGDGQFNDPNWVAVDASGNVYVSDAGCELCETENANNRIEKFTNDGRFITTWGSYGLGDGQFNLPLGLGADSNGNVFVNDEWNGRVQEFAPCGAGGQGCPDAADAASAVTRGEEARVAKGAPVGRAVPLYRAARGALSVADKAPARSRAVALAGAVVDFTPSSLSLKIACTSSVIWECGQATGSVTLTNVGSATLEIVRITISGTGFSQTNNCVSVAPGASCTIDVTFHIADTGKYTGSISVSDNGAGSPQTVPLSGSATCKGITCFH
jgi:hypothetical protein